MGITAVLFHSLLYVFANMAAFMVAAAFHQATGSDEIKDYAGLARRSPLLATVILFALLSLAGIPPLAGFWSKFYLFTAAITRGYVWLALVALVMTMVSVYYYLLVVKAMFIKEPPAGSPPVYCPAGSPPGLLRGHRPGRRLSRSLDGCSYERCPELFALARGGANA